MQNPKKPKKNPDDIPAPTKELTDRPPATLIYHNQNSSYRENNKCEADNNLMFEEVSNPLSSKGN